MADEAVNPFLDEKIEQIHLKTGGLVLIEVSQLAEPFKGKLLFSVNPENISENIS